MTACRNLILLLFVPLLLTLNGCSPLNDVEESDGAQGGDVHDHHHHYEGPHEGHLVELGQEKYQAEWKHDDNSGKVTVFILDAAAKKEAPISADHITIKIIVESELTQFQLAAINPQDGKSSEFEIIDKALTVALGVGDGVQATIEFDMDGTSYAGKIEHDEHEH